MNGNFPLGETCPHNTSTEPGPVCSPGKSGATRAVMFGLSTHASIMTGPPTCRITIVLLQLAAVGRMISSEWVQFAMLRLKSFLSIFSRIYLSAKTRHASCWPIGSAPEPHPVPRRANLPHGGSRLSGTNGVWQMPFPVRKELKSAYLCYQIFCPAWCRT